jgi:hypothetical protein
MGSMKDGSVILYVFFFKKHKDCSAQPDPYVTLVEVGHAQKKQNQPLRLVSFESILAFFKRSVIRFFSVLTRFFHCSFRAFHADLALAEASRAVFQRQHLLVSQHLQRHFLLDGTLSELSKSRT